MTRQEFLDGLRRALSGEVPESRRQSDLQYYDEYISGEIARGRSEAEVLEELGDPRLIARSIIDAQGAETEARREPVNRWDSGDADQESPFGTRMIRFSGWKATLAIVLVIVVLLGILSLLFSAAFAILRSPVFWVILVVWMLWRVREDRKRGGGGGF